MEISENAFVWQDYLVFAAVLASSLLIGVYFAIFGNKKNSNDDFLMASRSMGIMPVTFSLMCSMVSAIWMLGSASEVYNYGMQYTSGFLGLILMTIILVFLYVPVYFNLKLTSAYEYFEMRFDKKIRRLISITAIVHLLIHMPASVYGPAPALDQVAGLDRYISSAAIFIVCIIYSSIGGLKAVLWTDSLQAKPYFFAKLFEIVKLEYESYGKFLWNFIWDYFSFTEIIMFASAIMAMGFGLSEVGTSNVWKRAQDTGRDLIFEFDIDPRSRFTVWTGLIGEAINWIILFGATQGQIQRYNSVSTLRNAQICLILNMFGLIAFLYILSFLGLTMFAYYYNCDPIGANRVEGSDQLLPLFVLDVMGKHKGLSGFFVAGITSGSLSNISSGLNALATLITEDFIKKYRPIWNEKKLLISSRVITLICGIISFALVFVIASVGDILPFVSILHGTFLGPIFALFTLGLFFPWANSLGSVIGVGFGIIITLFIGIGTILAGNDDKLPNQTRGLTTDGCPIMNNTFSEQNFSNFSIKAPYDEWKEISKDDSALIKLFSLSYLYLPLITFLVTLICGLIFSCINNLWENSQRGFKRKLIEKRFMSRPLITMWKMVLTQEYLEKWIEFSDDEKHNE